MLLYLPTLTLALSPNKLIGQLADRKMSQSADRKMSQSAERRVLMATGEGRWSQFWIGNWKRNNIRKVWKFNCKWLYCELYKFKCEQHNKQRRNWIFVFAFQRRSQYIDYILDIEDMSKCNIIWWKIRRWTNKTKELSSAQRWVSKDDIMNSAIMDNPIKHRRNVSSRRRPFTGNGRQPQSTTPLTTRENTRYSNTDSKID